MSLFPYFPLASPSVRGPLELPPDTKKVPREEISNSQNARVLWKELHSRGRTETQPSKLVPSSMLAFKLNVSAAFPLGIWPRLLEGKF